MIIQVKNPRAIEKEAALTLELRQELKVCVQSLVLMHLSCLSMTKTILWLFLSNERKTGLPFTAQGS